MQRVGTERDEVLKLCGFMALHIPVAPFRNTGTSKWVCDPIAAQRDLTTAT